DSFFTYIRFINKEFKTNIGEEWLYIINIKDSIIDKNINL
ncbi:hypothetical protein SAMN04488528_106510, partial [Clostridium frigidicarnis]